MARALEQRPRVLVLEEPTEGVDVGAVGEIHDMLKASARDGMAVVVCSSDVTEIANLCSRVLVLRNGRVRADLRPPDLSRERLTRECHDSSGG